MFLTPALSCRVCAETAATSTRGLVLKKGKNAAARVHFWFGLLLFSLGSLHG